jgi:hypothetical protein
LLVWQGIHCIDVLAKSFPMRLREPELTADDDAAPVDMLAALFEARGWPFEIISDDEVTGEVQGSWAKYQLRAIWRGDDNVLQLLCLPDIRVSKEKHRQAHELLALVNEQMWLGHFDDGMLSIGQAQALTEIAIDECDRFYPAFQFVLWGDKEPRAALDAALVDAAGEA